MLFIHIALLHEASVPVSILRAKVTLVRVRVGACGPTNPFKPQRVAGGLAHHTLPTLSRPPLVSSNDATARVARPVVTDGMPPYNL